MPPNDAKPEAGESRSYAVMTFFDFLAKRIAARLKKRSPAHAAVPAEPRTNAKERKKKRKG